MSLQESNLPSKQHLCRAKFYGGLINPNFAIELLIYFKEIINGNIPINTTHHCHKFLTTIITVNISVHMNQIFIKQGSKKIKTSCFENLSLCPWDWQVFKMTKMDDNSFLENQCREDVYSEQIHAHVICFTPQMLKQLPIFIRM